MFTDQFSQLSFPLHGLVRLPDVTIAPEVRTALKIPVTVSNKDLLKCVVWAGYQSLRQRGKFAGIDEKTVIDRLASEFKVFEATGIINYILLVWNFTNWCDNNGVPRGPGRGSVAGSLSCYAAGITKVNPITHRLNFTRFISEARAKPKIIDGVLYASGKSLCDIDLDISFSQRDKVLAYLDTQYVGRTTKICNRLELTGKMALKDTLKIYLGYGEEESRAVTNHIEAIFGKVESLTEALERHKELRDWVAKNPRNARAVKIAQQISGLAVAKGVHASGVFLSYHPIDGNVPIELSRTKEVVTSYDMDVVAEIGVKLDVLALKTVDVIDETCKMLGIKADDIDVNHPSIYAYLSSTDRFYGAFQIEDGVTKDVVCKLGPRHIDDLAACLAIGRPGSLKHKDALIEYVKTGKRSTVYPAMDDILTPTGGIIIYQESINDICQQVYKMSAVDADEVRRAIGKKIKEDMVKWEPVLYQNGRANGIPDTVTKYFWDTCNASADYLFSKNHCYAYTYITAQTIYLKANHPKEFMLSLLRMARNETETQTCISIIIGECNQMGVKVLPPDILKSGSDFEIDKEQDGLRFGLGQMRGVSDVTMQKLASFKRDFDSKFDLFEAAKAAKISISVLTSLIYSGCLDSVIHDGSSRATLALNAQLYNLLTPNEKVLARRYADEYKEDLLALIRGMSEKLNEKGKPLIRPTRLETLRRDYADYWTMYQANSRNEELTSFVHERHNLGFSFTTTLHKVFSKRITGLAPIKDVLKGTSNTTVRFVAFVGEGKMHVSAKGAPYWKADVLDDTSTLKVMVHGEERCDACRSYNGAMPVKDDIVTVSGTLSKDGGIFFADSVIVQPSPLARTKGEVTL